MSTFADRSIRWLTKLLAARPKDASGQMPGVATVLDGMTAIAAGEAAWCETAGLGASYPASLGCRAWDRLAMGGTCNAMGARLGALRAESPQGALAAAIGAASSGLRATAFLSGTDLASCGALLYHASERRLPLVVHAALPSHEALFDPSAAGWCRLVATNAEEAIDLAFAARIAAERSLVPVMIGMDAMETGLGVGDVHLPEPELVRELLGRPGQRVKPPTKAQRLLFGEHRAKVHRWHDLDNPLRSGARAGGTGLTGAAAAGREFFTRHAEPMLRQAYATVSEKNGRPIEPLLLHNTKNAKVVFVGMGSVVEQLIQTSDYLLANDKLRVGVIGVRQLRPWADDVVDSAIGGAESVIVLERASAPLAGDGPLTSEVHNCLSRELYSTRITTAVYGLGEPGATMRELVALAKNPSPTSSRVLYLGMSSGDSTSASPRAQVVHDAIKRDVSGLSRFFTLDAGEMHRSPSTPGCVRVAVARGGAGDQALASLAGRLLGRVMNERVRSLMDAAGEPGAVRVDRIAAGPGATTPASDGECDIALVEPGAAQSGVLPHVREGGTVVFAVAGDPDATLALPRAAIDAARARKLKLMLVKVSSAKAYEQPNPVWRTHEAMLGGLIAALDDIKPVTRTKASAARGAVLAEDDQKGNAERQQAFDAAMGACRTVELDSIEIAPGTDEQPHTPVMLDRLGSSGSGVHDLATYWALREPGRDARAVDPFDAVPVTPALSSALRPVADPAGELVAFDPESCLGDGALWTSCPDGSVCAVALGVRELFAAGIELAGQAGHEAGALAPVLGNLAKLAHKRALAAPRPPTSVREACEDVYAELIEKMSPPADRRAAIDGAFGAVMDTIGLLPIARTRPFFDEPEAESPGSGALLVVGCNPDACKSARVAIGACEGRGLKIIERTASNLERARILWRIFERLPDTNGQVIKRSGGTAGVGPLAATMLAKSCALAMSPGDASEPGCGARLALRSVLAVCEAQVQPRVQAQIARIAELRDRLGGQVRQTLADSLPSEDLDALSAGLESLGREDFDLSHLSDAVGQAVTSQRVDGQRLGRLVQVARELADVQFRLERGASGLGRARTGMVISAGSATLWAIESPLNPFQGPVTVDATGRAPEIARGLCEGQMAATVESARIVRWAEAELDRPGEAALEPARLLGLGWDDLSPEEQAACPPLLLVGDDESLTSGALGSLLWLLGSRLPVKVVVLTGAGGRVDGGKSVDAQGSFPAGVESDCSLLAMLGRKAFVARCSIAFGDHLAQSVRRAVAHAGPALLHIHAPSPSRHGFDPKRLLMQAELAVHARVHCLFRYDPSAGGVFGSCLDLTGNPDPLEASCKSEKGELTPIDWAITEGRFADHFGPVDSGASTVPVAQYLRLPAAERPGKAATLTNPLDHAEQSPSADLTAFADDRLRLWRTLQELAGLVTPFTQRVREDAEDAVAGERQAELAALEHKHEQELTALRTEQNTEAVARLRGGLMRLTGIGHSGENGHA